MGPTASGKSALASALATRCDGALLVNADALQVYDGWRLLTARPDATTLARAEHALYGHVDPADPGYSTGRWLREVEALLSESEARRRVAIFIGGTGLYYKTLTEGLAPIPAIPAEIRAEVESELAAQGLAAATARLEREDPRSAARVDRQNPRRVQRALEVLDATGTGLADWADRTAPPLLPLDHTIALRLSVDRAALRRRIRRRLEAMVAQGVLQEVAAMRARLGGFDGDLPAMKALGARAFAAHLDGKVDLEEAIADAALETGRYAKRQDTWARNQFSHWRALEWGDDPEAAIAAAAQALAEELSRTT